MAGECEGERSRRSYRLSIPPSMRDIDHAVVLSGETAPPLVPQGPIRDRGSVPVAEVEAEADGVGGGVRALGGGERGGNGTADGDPGIWGDSGKVGVAGESAESEEREERGGGAAEC